MARVIETHPDANGLVRKVTLEARPHGGPLGLPYVPKDLEKFNMAVQCLVLIHPQELEIPNIQDFTTMKENATTEDLPFAKEKAVAGDTAIAMEKPGPKDSDTLPERDDMEKAKMAADTTPEKVSTEKAEMAAEEDSTEMAADSTPKEDSQEKAELAADQEDLELVVAEDPKKVNLNSGT